MSGGDIRQRLSDCTINMCNLLEAKYESLDLSLKVHVLSHLNDVLKHLNISAAYNSKLWCFHILVSRLGCSASAGCLCCLPGGQTASNFSILALIGMIRQFCSLGLSQSLAQRKLCCWAQSQREATLCYRQEIVKSCNEGCGYQEVHRARGMTAICSQELCYWAKAKADTSNGIFHLWVIFKESVRGLVL